MNEREHRKSVHFVRAGVDEKNYHTKLDWITSDLHEKIRKNQKARKEKRAGCFSSRERSLFSIARAQHRRSEDHREVRGDKERREKGNRNDAPRARERQRDERRITLDRRRRQREREREREVGKKRKRKKGFLPFFFAPRASYEYVYIESPFCALMLLVK